MNQTVTSREREDLRFPILALSIVPVFPQLVDIDIEGRGFSAKGPNVTPDSVPVDTRVRMIILPIEPVVL